MKHRIWTIILLIGLLGLLLSACTDTGSGSQDTGTEQSRPVTDDVPVPTESESQNEPDPEEPEESFVVSEDMKDADWTPNY